MEYVVAIADHLKPQGGKLSGRSYLSRLNEERVSFKHKGSLRHVPQWHAVGTQVRHHVEQWCRDHFGMEFTDLGLDILIEDQEVRAAYLDAKERCDQGDYKGSLEALGVALYMALRQLPGIFVPTVGSVHVEDGLRLAGFGVHGGNFLTLQQLLPAVWPDTQNGGFTITWDTRERGHPANWTEANVRFCLEGFLDAASKVQHAPWAPWPVHFGLVYVDTATAKQDGATVWRYPAPFETLSSKRRNRPCGS